MTLLSKAIQVLVTGLLMCGSTAVLASTVTCSDLFGESSRVRSDFEKSAAKDWNERRAAVVAFLKSHPEVPSFMKQTERGSVPVILLNEVTYPVLAPLLEESVGYGFNMSAPGGSDHAMLRVEGTIMDTGHPGTRRGGEINRNGVKWIELGATLPWRRVMIQNSYLMPKADREAARFYQLVRRASFFRTRYAFANDWEVDRITPNLVENVLENCFRFCKSDQAPQMLEGFKVQLESLLGADLQGLRESAEVATFLKLTRSEVLKTNPYDEEKLNWNLSKAANRKSGLDSKLMARFAPLQREAIANLLVSEQAVTQYLEVLRRYGVSDHHGFQDIDAGRVSFTFIMDNISVADQFRRGHYEAHGAFFHWLPQGQSPLP